tara:strand:- start:3680 stop:4456 length:777 start_codon:yes stop_codon:yes gene_type:complete
MGTGTNHIGNNTSSPMRYSSGIVLAREKDGKLQYLLVRRRHSYAYVDIVCGRYNSMNIIYLIKLCLQLTPQERINLQQRPFNNIWEDLWIKIDSGSRNYKHAYDKFNNMARSGKKYGISHIIRQIPCTWDEAEWGFPKGRREKNENELECALRELLEETNIPEKDILQIFPKTVSETIIGTNNLIYRNEYYIAIVNVKTDPVIKRSNWSQNQEIGDIGWFTYNECIKKYRSYEEKKRHTLRHINKILTQMQLNNVFNY